MKRRKNPPRLPHWWLFAVVLVASCALWGQGESTSPRPQAGFNILYGFTGGGDGAHPRVFATDGSGNLYGIVVGGANGYGTIFKISPKGQLTTLHSFSPTDPLGYAPSSMISDSAGNLYVSTSSGVFFKIDARGQYSVLLSNTAVGNFAIDAKGNIYGTTGGGTGKFGCGTIFRYDTKSGAYKTVHNVNGTTDGCSPNAPVVLDGAGSLYFVTYGSSGSSLVKLSLSNGRSTNLHVFGTLPSDGDVPDSLALDSNGTLYGTTLTGGVKTTGYYCSYVGSPCGTIFQYSSANGYQLVYAFGGGPDGGGPAAMRADSAGNIYGVTMFGGSAGAGTIYKLTPGAATPRVIHSFSGAVSGSGPDTIVLAPDGQISGGTIWGGPFLPTGFGSPRPQGTIFTFVP
jgi:uncharacterized repeat protein (TIGR03803 family)